MPASPALGSYGAYDPVYSSHVAGANPAGSTMAPGPMPPTPPPPVPQAPSSLISQMLAESSPAPSGGGACGWGCGPGVAPSAPDCGPQTACCFEPKWYVSAAGLIMTRDMANGVWTTYETGNNPNQLTRTSDADCDWRAGYDVMIGYRFGTCACWAIEGGYWTIDRLFGYARTSLPGTTVSTPLHVDEVEFAGVPGTYFFDNAAEHVLRRSDRIQSAEVSLVRRFPCDPGSGSYTCWDLSLLAGARYFNFEEELTWGSLASGGTWGGNGGLDEAYFREYVVNNLIGFQFGADAGYRVARSLRLFVTPKLGIYNNHIESRTDLFRGDGVQANPTAASGVVGTYPVYAQKDVFAFLAQIDVGADWEFYPGWFAFAGYRLVAATGIALADHQIPPYLVDLPAFADINTNGDLLLHGGFAGLRINF